MPHCYVVTGLTSCRYKIGDSYFSLPVPEVQELLTGSVERIDGEVTTLEETLMRLSSQVSVLSRQQKYFRTRENRNFSTVKSTEKRIFNLSMIESGLMIAMAGFQVFVVKMFFTGGRKGMSEW